MLTEVSVYQPKHKIRILTAASLFDGHDAAINIMRRIMQSSGAEIIHLGHNRSALEIVEAAIQEDVQGIAITSYQGGHNEFFKYIFDLLKDRGCGHIKIFGGGGGTILPSEIEDLHAYGITRIYSPDDGRHLGLQGMINDVIRQCDFETYSSLNGEMKAVVTGHIPSLSRLISVIENNPQLAESLITEVQKTAKAKTIPVLGITGTGGAGKSSLVDELVRRFVLDFPEKRLAILSVDPSKRKTGGALLGDRIRMNSMHPEFHGGRVFMRSLATRQSNLALSPHIKNALQLLKASPFDLIILETSGIGQSDTEIVDFSDVSLYVMTPEYGAATQLEKIDMLDFADLVAINKFDKRGAMDALRDVRKQFQRNHKAWESSPEDMPVYGTIASQFNDPGTNQLYKQLLVTVAGKTGVKWNSSDVWPLGESEKIYIIPPARTRYLSEISDNNRNYDKWCIQQSNLASQSYSLRQTMKLLDQSKEAKVAIESKLEEVELQLEGSFKNLLEAWPHK